MHISSKYAGDGNQLI